MPTQRPPLGKGQILGEAQVFDFLGLALTHGVQPIENTIPKSIDEENPRLLTSMLLLLVRFKKPIFNNPRKFRPNAITIRPVTILRTVE
jgi:hypothetical protein